MKTFNLKPGKSVVNYDTFHFCRPPLPPTHKMPDRDLTDMNASSMEHGGAVDEYTKQERLSLSPTPPDKSPHNDFPPWFVKPVANQFWLPEELGGGSSLSLNPSTRVASTNDLVLDLVVVYILHPIVSIVGTSTIVPLTPANGDS